MPHGSIWSDKLLFRKTGRNSIERACSQLYPPIQAFCQEHTHRHFLLGRNTWHASECWTLSALIWNVYISYLDLKVCVCLCGHWSNTSVSSDKILDLRDRQGVGGRMQFESLLYKYTTAGKSGSTEGFAEHLFGFLSADSPGQDQHLYFENIDMVTLPEDKTRSSQSNNCWTINQKHSHLAVRRARLITYKHK